MKTLIITDVQQDFLPGMALGVPKGDEIVPIINACQPSFERVVATVDWHPKGHVSFASTHHKAVGESIQVQESPQMLWPDHCIQYTAGSSFASQLKLERIASIFHKGTDLHVDSYSAFFDQSRKKATGLEEYLRSRQLKNLYFVGLATDYCVLYSVLDALDLGFNVSVIRDACRGINIDPMDEEKALQVMKKQGAKIVFSHQVINPLC